MCAWDTETTGTDPETARIVTSAQVIVQPGSSPQSTELLLNPGIEIPEEATAVHGITTETARNEGEEAAFGVEAICGGLVAAATAMLPVVIFNASYDLTVLHRECRRYGLPTLAERMDLVNRDLYVVDPLVLDRKLDRYRKGKRTLEAAAEHYNVRQDEAHNAAGDCLTALRVAYKVASTYPKVAAMPLPALHEFQKESHFEWAEGFEQYLRRENPDAVVDRSWPIRPVGAEVA